LALASLDQMGLHRLTLKRLDGMGMGWLRSWSWSWLENFGIRLRIRWWQKCRGKMCVNKFNQTTMSADTCILLGIWARRVGSRGKKRTTWAPSREWKWVLLSNCFSYAFKGIMNKNFVYLERPKNSNLWRQVLPFVNTFDLHNGGRVYLSTLDWRY